MSLRSALVTGVVLVLVTLATAAGDADARRVCHGCRYQPGPRVEGVPQACRVRAFTAVASARWYRFGIQRLVVRLDGRVVARTRSRVTSVALSCRGLAPGTHRVSVSLRDVRERVRSRRVKFTVLPAGD
jgi:hypothetical protein